MNNVLQINVEFFQTLKNVTVLNIHLQDVITLNIRGVEHKYNDDEGLLKALDWTDMFKNIDYSFVLKLSQYINKDTIMLYNIIEEVEYLSRKSFDLYIELIDDFDKKRSVNKLLLKSLIEHLKLVSHLKKHDAVKSK